MKLEDSNRFSPDLETIKEINTKEKKNVSLKLMPSNSLTNTLSGFCWVLGSHLLVAFKCPGGLLEVDFGQRVTDQLEMAMLEMFPLLLIV
jgi:hypothetical protein